MTVEAKKTGKWLAAPAALEKLSKIAKHGRKIINGGSTIFNLARIRKHFSMRDFIRLLAIIGGERKRKVSKGFDSYSRLDSLLVLNEKDWS